ncbi:unnamed protein product [Didymodactylos carnosus]|uniref:Tetratricopeptide repeat protein n=1 Tax=Didymodactylos carnosus TaxID=1234261 RepID=A0A814X0Y7_9BILA|nr:unnamed protein product [Didymodactylos carnosus]CAF3973809.1 unnamed protein product [Didymodactylos carnosus]
MLNKALRVQNIDILFVLRFLIVDIHNQLIKESSNTSISRLYRGQVMSKDELSRIRSSIGEFISINSFLSTTRSPKKALEFAQSAQCEAQYECVLFKIKVESRIKAKPFADISRLSYFPAEEEILIMLGSIFRLESVHFDKQQQIWVADLDLCNEDDHDLKQVFDYMKKEIGSETTLISLGNLFNVMGELDKAEKYYKRLLNQLSVGDSGIPYCYVGLGNVARHKREYDLALMNYNKALKIFLKALPPDHPDIAQTYNNIGGVQGDKGEYDLALINYDKALKIRVKALPPGHPHIAETYGNIANVQGDKGEYDLALMNHDKALKIFLKALPPDHPDIAQTYNNIGGVQYDKGEYDLALMNYDKALKIFLKALPPDHPDIASTYRNMGLVHEATCTWQSALEYHNKAATIRRRSLAITHPQLVTTESDIRRVKAQLK